MYSIIILLRGIQACSAPVQELCPEFTRLSHEEVYRPHVFWLSSLTECKSCSIVQVSLMLHQQMCHTSHHLSMSIWLPGPIYPHIQYKCIDSHLGNIYHALNCIRTWFPCPNAHLQAPVPMQRKEERLLLQPMVVIG